MDNDNLSTSLGTTGYGSWGGDAASSSNPWNVNGVLPSNMYNSSEAINADKRSFVMQLQNQSYNSSEAQKNRDWQTNMSNTAVQRALADYKAAGFSPLAVLGSGGASTPSGSAAHSSASSSRGGATDAAGIGILKGLISLVGAVVSQGVSSAVKTGLAASQAVVSAPAAENSASRYAVSDSAINDLLSRYRSKSKGYLNKPISEAEFQSVLNDLDSSLPKKR